MYSLMALAGDLGCASGPFIAGMICNFATANGANKDAYVTQIALPIKFAKTE